ncbi:MAG: FAD-dependent oxidoreductase [Dehalococcoidia bacterium]|nr:FAD-dependent oxidoreductase [Dehalococcoidia bacterium]
MSTRLTRLFEPVKIGNLEIKNRIVMPGLNSKLGTEFGAVSERLIDYYEGRARGGVGLIIIENTCIDWPVGKAGTNPIRADEWKFVQGLHELAEAVHAHGAKIATQLQHTGRQGSSMTSAEGHQLVAPSALPCLPTGAEMPRELTVDDIEALIGKFTLGAAITKTAGFDAVELQGGHGYLINQFMSPYTNRRQDEYGGDFEGRMKFALRVVEGVRTAVGPGFPMIVRLSGDEYIDGGLTVEDMVLVARRLEAAGVDAISVSAGIYESPPWYSRIFPTAGMPEGCNVPLAAQIKKAIGIPVIVAGKLGDPERAEQVLRDGSADLIAIGRPLLADPELPGKAYEGRLGDIRPCLYCNEACAGSISRMWRIECSVNPALGREGQAQLIPADTKKRLVVVGGGPAGMEAASVAALRGHDVTLFEKGRDLGGQLRAASVPVFKRPIGEYVEYLKNRVYKAGVKVHSGKKATPKLIRALQPDAVVLATGSTHILPDFGRNGGARVATAIEVLLGRKHAGKKVAVIGGGEIGAELAWYLAEKGKQVKIIEMTYGVAEGMNLFSRLYLLDILSRLGIESLTNMTARDITEAGVVVEDAGGSRQLVEADTVVVAMGFRPETALYDSLAGKVPELHRIGDCAGAGKIYGAVHSAWRIANQI